MGSGIFASGIGAPEGPVRLDDGSMYVPEMSAATLCVTKLSATGERRVVKPTRMRVATRCRS